MRFALINSGLGLLSTASELRKLRPDTDLVIAMDPDGMPWGPRTPEDIAARSLAMARMAVAYQPDVIIMACNTGTVHALDVLRAEFEPAIPVVGTVPAIKPAAAAARSVAIWATVATTASEYQQRLIAQFGGGAEVTQVACPGLATAVDAGDADAIDAAIADAASRTPPDCGAVVLGCTEYELAAELIAPAVPGALLFGSAIAVAAQALRRAALTPPDLASAGRSALGTLRTPGTVGTATTAAAAPLSHASEAAATAPGRLSVLLSGRVASLPPAALQYRQGRELAQLAELPGQPDPAPELAVLPEPVD
jgi:glutamate racemase